MEYYCSKDTNIAFRIFELGLKKFPDNAEYIMCYIDYLSHLNEDNNTRVLFERVLTSGSLPPEKSVDVWNKFLEFESNIGDLASIIKTEKRRGTVLNQLKEFEGKETAQIVDRYKFLDLFPCTTSELRSIGYTEVLSVSSQSAKMLLPMAPEEVSHEEEEEEKIVRPDFSQMIPFKPKPDAYPGEHPVPGGTFPMPPAVAYVNTLLPPPTYFHGPFVAVDKLMEIFHRLQLPDRVPPPTGEGVDPSVFDIAKAANWNPEIHEDNTVTRDQQNNRGGRRAFKRKGGNGPDDKRQTGNAVNHESEDDESSSAPPVNDIYRYRQQKRVKS
jgi:cleavage stimulation factor subunit 3